jgi:hypothetical protein
VIALSAHLSVICSPFPPTPCCCSAHGMLQHAFDDVAIWARSGPADPGVIADAMDILVAFHADFKYPSG